MADIQNKILSKYGFDIAQENIFKLYKIESADIEAQELENKILETRKRWNTSVNGANEKNAERDRVRLQNADKYEAVLRNADLRKEVYAFYNKASDSNSKSTSHEEGSVEFAKEYFDLVATTKKIKKEDVDFFFKYYKNERKNKKAILTMLKDMKVIIPAGEGKFADEGDEDTAEGKKKDDSSALIVNLFQEATVLKICKAVEKYEEAVKSSEICLRYPDIRNGLYEFLGIKDVEAAGQFVEIMSARGKEVYSVRQEKGAEYVPLVDLFNILQSIGSYQDVVDNMPEFKLLLKYPALTPYMYAFVDMKPATVKGMMDVANREYRFRDETDFILNYYEPVHDNFGISDGGISAIIRKADKKAKQNKVTNNIDEKLEKNKKNRVPAGAMLLHWLAYFPIFAVYFIFEVSKAVFTKLHYFTGPIFVALFCLENWMFPKFGIDNLFVFRKLIYKEQWLEFLKTTEDFLGPITANMYGRVTATIFVIFTLLAIYILPPLFVSVLVKEFTDDFNKRFDWVGIKRTFRKIFISLKNKTQEQYSQHKNIFIKEKLGKILVNLLCIALLAGIIIYAPIVFVRFSLKTGYFLK